MWKRSYLGVAYYILRFSLYLRILCEIGLAQADETLLLPSKDIDTDIFLDSYSAYNRYTINEKKVNSTVLIYVTPWNKRGFEISKTFVAKFDIISPVWFQVLERKKAYTVTGIPNIDTEWMTKLKISNSEAKIVPRFIFEAWKAEHFVETMSEPKNADACITNIVRVLNNHNFDGAVIEIWSQFVGLHERELVLFVQRICGAIHERNLLCILVIPPPVYRDNIEGRFTRKHFDQLSTHVDYFSLMTYDYSPPSLCRCLSDPDVLASVAEVKTAFNTPCSCGTKCEHH
ncbi:unnamed protein product [Dicrocoelium dendriticum]|nr:unnamed protein product [Dicrocoelium dendriticum]